MTLVDTIIETLARSATFRSLEHDVIVAIVAAGKPIEISTGDVVFCAGDPYQQSLFVIVSGEFDFTRADGSTERYGTGNILGLSNYLDGEPYRSSVRAACDSCILKLSEAAVHQFEQDHSVFADLLNHVIAERIRARRNAATISGALTQPVRTVMKSPLSVCDADLSLREAFQMMKERKIGSLGVLADAGKLVGVLTYAGLSAALLEKGASPGDSIMEAACEVPRVIEQEAPLWQADEKLQDFTLKYLVVTEAGKPVGMISQSDILNLHRAQQPWLLQHIRATMDFDALQNCYTSLVNVAREARDSNRLASIAVRILSDSHLSIQRRCVELTLEEMEQAGHGAAPRPYAVLIMGSGGRREMLLTPDQDNGLIIDDVAGPLNNTESAWFERLSEQLNLNLDKAGYILCPGDIMARNPMFRKTLTEWKQQIDHLVRQPNQKAARWSNIVFDFDTLYGDDRLTHALRTHLLSELQQHRALLGYMVEDDAEGRPPLGLFNRLITTDVGEHKGKIDIKRNGLRIIADAARIYALSMRIASHSTLERLQALVRHSVVSADLVDSVLAAFEELLDLLLAHQIEQREAGVELDKLVEPDGLSSLRRSTLRSAMRAVKRFQDQLQGDFGRAAF